MSISVLIITGSTFGSLFFAAILTGRLYCNSICPVGALLGIVSRFSLFTLRIDRSSCTSCNVCEKLCKAGCIRGRDGDIDTVRCVSCFNCLAYCPTSSIGYRLRMIDCCNGGSLNNLKRRAFMGSMAAIVLTWPTYPLLFASPRKKTFMDTSPISPPGSISLLHYTSRCSGCHLCVSACPTHTLVPTLWKYGFSGLLQPEMNYLRGHCEISCTVCGSVCPTGAIMPLAQDEKKLIQIGLVSRQ